MKKVIVLASVTYALRSQELLRDNGIYSYLIRSRSVKAVRGCGYGISVDNSVLGRALAVLADNGITVVGVTEEK